MASELQDFAKRQAVLLPSGPGIPVIPIPGGWKVEGLDTPVTVYTPDSFTIKPTRKNFERLLPKVQFLWTVQKWKKCPSTRLVDKSTLWNLPIIFRLLKNVWKISWRARRDLLPPSAQPHVYKSTLAYFRSLCVPYTFLLSTFTVFHLLTFSCSSWSSSTVSSVWRLPCFPYLELIVSPHCSPRIL